MGLMSARLSQGRWVQGTEWTARGDGSQGLVHGLHSRTHRMWHFQGQPARVFLVQIIRSDQGQSAESQGHGAHVKTNDPDSEPEPALQFRIHRQKRAGPRRQDDPAGHGDPVVPQIFPESSAWVGQGCWTQHLGGNQRCPVSQVGARSSKSGCLQGWLLKVTRWDLFLASLPAAGVFC